MPCLIKLPKKNSPGIVTFNTNELFSDLFKKKVLINFLRKNKRWIFGVNLSGSYERLKDFPDESWVSFIMCYSLKSPYLNNIDTKKKIDISYINFLEIYDFELKKKNWDICIVSRDSEIKRISYTVRLIKSLLKKNENIRILIVVPDTRSTYEKTSFNIFNKESYFNIVSTLLSNNEKKNIDFISCDTNIFGNYALSEKTLYRFISESKYVMINSKKEGINRAIIEGLCYGSKAIVHSDLESELDVLYLNNENTIFIDEDLDSSSKKIISGLKNFNINSEDINKYRDIFSSIYSKEKIKIYLQTLFENNSLSMDGKWYLNNLSKRLCNHGSKGLYTIQYSSKKFFEWFNKIEKLDEDFIDEDNMYEYRFEDKPNLFQYSKSFLKKIIFCLKNEIIKKFKMKTHGHKKF